MIDRERAQLGSEKILNHADETQMNHYSRALNDLLQLQVQYARHLPWGTRNFFHILAVEPAVILHINPVKEVMDIAIPDFSNLGRLAPSEHSDAVCAYKIAMY
jgi:hypothetical protein